MITKSKIDWTDFTWSPVWGCLNKCPYCYAQKIARRFAERIAEKECIYNLYYFDNHRAEENKKEILYNLQNFQPTWLESNYQKTFPKKPSRIFVNSMSDPMYWEQSWYEKIVKRIAENMQHTFMILTKHPEVYERWHFPRKWTFPHNVWLGLTITNQKQMDLFADKYFEMDWPDKNNLFFISLEPIQEKIKLYVKPDWLIVGFQTNPLKKLERKIIMNIIIETGRQEIPLFLKNSIYKVYKDIPLIKEFPNA